MHVSISVQQVAPLSSCVMACGRRCAPSDDQPIKRVTKRIGYCSDDYTLGWWVVAKVMMIILTVKIDDIERIAPYVFGKGFEVQLIPGSFKAV